MFNKCLGDFTEPVRERAVGAVLAGLPLGHQLVGGPVPGRLGPPALLRCLRSRLNHRDGGLGGRPAAVSETIVQRDVGPPGRLLAHDVGPGRLLAQTWPPHVATKHAPRHRPTPRKSE